MEGTAADRTRTTSEDCFAPNLISKRSDEITISEEQVTMVEDEGMSLTEVSHDSNKLLSV
jgi:hypothetical protein